MGNGELKLNLEISANRFSTSAKSVITESGSKYFYVLKLNQLQGIAQHGSHDNISSKEISQYFSYIGESDNIHIISEGNISTKFNIQVHKVDSDVISMLEKHGSTVTIL